MFPPKKKKSIFIRIWENTTSDPQIYSQEQTLFFFCRLCSLTLQLFLQNYTLLGEIFQFSCLHRLCSYDLESQRRQRCPLLTMLRYIISLIGFGWWNTGIIALPYTTNEFCRHKGAISWAPVKKDVPQTDALKAIKHRMKSAPDRRVHAWAEL